MNKLQQIIEFLSRVRIALQGKKTEILATIGIAATVAFLGNYIDQSQWEAVVTMCGFGGYVTLGARVKRLISKK